MDTIALILAKKYTDASLAGLGAIKGLSAYEVAKANGYIGSEQEWLISLHGISPHIGENGHWFVGETDTGMIASPSLAGYLKNDQVTINGIPLATDSGIVDIPIATQLKLGVVKGSVKENYVTITDNGEMEVSSLNVNRLTQTEGEELILRSSL